ncbi:MAG TPA: TetR/AcrR family transcriptional regulator [Spirochaetota bacterium]|nr:TetR/AcrR family transcriptional regulator [Spirochaetota bacterium]HPI91321.1 TetR/AcrR family transcriptional regulator [Spirochaetota bacterium]HPR50052.1 TetR/AcrR family transcriptional regulator [Spirochaetota bacterium]
MPKKQRTPEEIEQVKTGILQHAVNLMNEVGYHDFSMRKLAREMKVTTPTLYSYYRNKEELYLSMLTEGFSRLYVFLLNGYEKSKNPFMRLRALSDAFVEFGLSSYNFYNLMSTWHVPHFDAYRGTDMEPAARNLFDISFKVMNLCIKTIRERAGKNYILKAKDARLMLVFFWSVLHGYIASQHNALLNYLPGGSPVSLKKEMIDVIRETFEYEINFRRVKTARKKS